jgi:hypothetical protein
MASVPEIHKCDGQGIQELCRRIAEGLEDTFKCPCCSADLRVQMSIHGAEVKCPVGCFHFHCQRDLHTGAFVTGFLDFPGPKCVLPNVASAGTEFPRASA